jgi:hypothetical protein
MQELFNTVRYIVHMNHTVSEKERNAMTDCQYKLKKKLALIRSLPAKHDKY